MIQIQLLIYRRLHNIPFSFYNIIFCLILGHVSHVLHFLALCCTSLFSSSSYTLWMYVLHGYYLDMAFVRFSDIRTWSFLFTKTPATYVHDIQQSMRY